MSRRAGHPVSLDDFDAFSRRVPVIANIRPSGDRYLMEDFFYAGGLRALLERIRSEEHTSELQSLTNLVCRLLLEKKKQINKTTAAGRKDPAGTSSARIALGYLMRRAGTHALWMCTARGGLCGLEHVAICLW